MNMPTRERRFQPAVAMVGLLLVHLPCAALEYAPKVEEVPRLFTWSVHQATEWASAGDKLHFDTDIDWRMAMRCTAVSGKQFHLKLTFVSVKATHTGPGADVHIDSATGAGENDPLLGHWLALAGKTIDLDVDATSGAVSNVSGGDAIIATINERAPSTIPGDPPPLDASARAAYGADALARLWSQILALPSANAEIALPPPFTVGTTLKRAWNATSWTTELPTNAKPIGFEISKDPSAVRGEVKKLSGTGSLTLRDGFASKAEGALSFTLAITALTQPVESQHVVKWTLVEMAQ